MMAFAFAFVFVALAKAEGETEAQTSQEQMFQEPVQTGWVLKAEGWYFYNHEGRPLTGWLQDGEVWYYFYENDTRYPGLMAANEEVNIAGADYLFGGSGAMQTGWYLRDGLWYYYTPSGAKAVGCWQYVDGVWYYFKSAYESPDHPGVMAANEEWNIGGENYLFGGSGAMQTGWSLRAEGWYYYTPSGARVKGGWQYIGERWYYFLSELENEQYPGLMFQNGKKEINGIEYYFDSSGAMQTGWLLEDGSWYYTDNNGYRMSGWVYVDGNWYYMDPANGLRMAASQWMAIDGSWYYFRGSGAMAVGWELIDGNWYYFNGSGAMTSGWQWAGDGWYYLYRENDPYGGPHGAMAYNQTIEGYALDESGRWLPTDQAAMLAVAQGYSSPTQYLILVNRSTHNVGVYQGWQGNWSNVHYWDCADGAPGTPTIAGLFSVGSKGYYFDSGAARCYWYTQFRGNYLFHSVLYNKDGTLQDGRVGMALSHGCVRLLIENAKWIYDNIPVGTTVLVY